MRPHPASQYAKPASRTHTTVRPLCLVLLAAGPCAFGLPIIPAAAAEEPLQDCRAVNRGSLNVELASPASAERKAKLKAGDVITVTFWPGPGSSGELTLLPTAGSTQVLVTGTDGQTISHTMASTGDVGFRFASEGGEGATFFITCAAAGARTELRK